MKILLIDNYDSFTFNLYHYISSLGVKVDVVRNDKITAKDIKKNKYNKIITFAFQRRFRQELVNGKIDKECLLISENLIKKLN